MNMFRLAEYSAKQCSDKKIERVERFVHKKI